MVGLALLLACGPQGASVTEVPLGTQVLAPQLLAEATGLAAVPSFADERGGGLFADVAGRVVRLKGDGQLGLLEAHPQTLRMPGPATGLFALGPFSALVATTRGLFFSESGWLIAPPWQQRLEAAGLKAVAVTPEGVAWLAHASGLYRLALGQLAELKVEGASLDDVTALAAGPAPDGVPVVWLARGAALAYVATREDGAPLLREVGLLDEARPDRVVSLAGLPAGTGRFGQLLVATTRDVYRLSTRGWQRYVGVTAPRRLEAGGRVAWLEAGDGLYRFDAVGDEWRAVQLEGSPTLLAADEAGAAWLRLGARTVSVAAAGTLRLFGLHESERLFDSQALVEVGVPASAVVESVGFSVDGEAPRPVALSAGRTGTGLQAGLRVFPLGGVDSEGRPQPVAFPGLTPGPHALDITVAVAGGGPLQRRVVFTAAASSGPLSWDRDIRPLSEARCLKCHAAGTEPRLVGVEAWQQHAGRIAEVVKDRLMPADGPMDPGAVLAIQRWVSQGAPP